MTAENGVAETTVIDRRYRAKITRRRRSALRPSLS
jgi:hypothetical protein